MLMFFSPQVKQEWWWVYLADRKSHKLVTLPQMVYDLKDEKEVGCFIREYPFCSQAFLILLCCNAICGVKF